MYETHLGHYNMASATDPFLDSALNKFLQGRRVVKNGEISMTAMDTSHGGKWYIPDNEYPQFLGLLHGWLFDDGMAPLTLVERRLSDGRTPLLIDLDFRYPCGRSMMHSFTKENILAFVTSITNCITHLFDIKDKPQIRFFVTLRPQAYIPRKAGGIKEVKDGVHIISPDIVLSKEQQKIMRAFLLEKSAVNEAFKDTGNTAPESQVFDQTMADQQGWQFYGESKKDVEHPYQLAYIWKYKPKTGKISEEKIDLYESRDLIELFSIRYNVKEPVKVRPECADEYEEIYEKIMSINTTVHTVNTAQPQLGEWSDVFTAVHPESDIKMAKRFTLECLSKDRADDYHSWIKVGWCIRNIDPSLDGFNLWQEFSMKSAKYNGNDVERLKRDWVKGTMIRIGEVKRIDYGSLVRWAKEDNPDKFEEIKNDNILNYIKQVALSFDGGTHHHVAEIMKRVYGDTYKCSVEHRGNEWFRFVGCIWEPVPQGIELKRQMSDRIAELVSDSRTSFRILQNSKRTTTEGGFLADDEKEDDKKLNKFLKLQANLYSASFKDSVMKECIQTFYEENFAQKMNRNLFTVGCSNGILHLRDPVFDTDGRTIKDYTVTLKQGSPEDYISFQAGKRHPELDPIEYIPYSADNPEIIEILDFFDKLFPDQDVREYVLLLAASCLEGCNREQCYYIMTGSGGNGKSKFVDLMQNTFGEYYSSLSTTALTRKRPDSGAANPDIMNIKNKRFISMQEPDEREQLNVARMKQFSGEDIVEARGLFKDQETFKITGKFFMSCNRLPPIHSMDDGTWRRLRVIPFKSKFVPPSDPTINPANNVYPRDPFLDEKLKRWRTSFFSLLVHYYKTKYMRDGIRSIPKEVRKFSDEYKQSYDNFSKFRDSRIRDVSTAKIHKRAELLTESVQFKEIRSAYRMWSQDSAGSKTISDNELRIRCQDAFGTPADGKTFKGVKIFSSDEEGEAFDLES